MDALKCFGSYVFLKLFFSLWSCCSIRYYIIYKYNNNKLLLYFVLLLLIFSSPPWPVKNALSRHNVIYFKVLSVFFVRTTPASQFSYWFRQVYYIIKIPMRYTNEKSDSRMKRPRSASHVRRVFRCNMIWSTLYVDDVYTYFNKR